MLPKQSICSEHVLAPHRHAAYRDAQAYIGKTVFAGNGAATQQVYHSNSGMVNTEHVHCKLSLFCNTALQADALAYACMDKLTLGSSSQLHWCTSAQGKVMCNYMMLSMLLSILLPNLVSYAVNSCNHNITGVSAAWPEDATVRP